MTGELRNRQHHVLDVSHTEKVRDQHLMQGSSNTAHPADQTLTKQLHKRIWSRMDEVAWLDTFTVRSVRGINTWSRSGDLVIANSHEVDLHEVFGIKSDKRRHCLWNIPLYDMTIGIHILNWSLSMNLIKYGLFTCNCVQVWWMDVRCQPNGCRHITHKPTRVQGRSNTLVKHNGGEEFDVYACPHDNI